MAVKRKGEWTHAAEREGEFLGLMFRVEAIPLYWTTTSFPCKHQNFFSKLKKILHVAWLLQQYMIMKKKSDFSAVKGELQPTLAGGCLCILPIVEQSSNRWHITSGAIQGSMQPQMWVGTNISHTLNLKWLHFTGVMPCENGWSIISDVLDKCSTGMLWSVPIFPHTNISFSE